MNDSAKASMRAFLGLLSFGLLLVGLRYGWLVFLETLIAVTFGGAACALIMLLVFLEEQPGAGR